MKVEKFTDILQVAKVNAKTQHLAYEWGRASTWGTLEPGKWYDTLCGKAIFIHDDEDKRENLKGKKICGHCSLIVHSFLMHLSEDWRKEVLNKMWTNIGGE